MKEFSANEIQQKFDSLSAELQIAITSPEIHDSILEIGKRNNLMIDQIGHLVDHTGLVLLGLASGKNFVDDIVKEVDIPKDKASVIAKEINTEIFSKIRQELREGSERQSELEQKTVSSFERLGELNVERTAVDPIQSTSKLQSREQILSGIENPVPSKEVKFPKSETFTEPLVDHLLNSFASRPAINEKIQEAPTHHTAMPPQNLPTSEVSPALEPKTPPVQTKPAEAPKKSGPDMYREVIG